MVFDAIFVHNPLGTLLALIVLAVLYSRNRLSNQVKIWDLYECFKRNVKVPEFLREVDDLFDEQPKPGSSCEEVELARSLVNRDIWTVDIMGATDWSTCIRLDQNQTAKDRTLSDGMLMETVTLHAMNALEFDTVDDENFEIYGNDSLRLIFCSYVFLALSTSLFGLTVFFAIPNWICITAIIVSIIRLINLDRKMMREKLCGIWGGIGVFPLLTPILLTVSGHSMIFVLVFIPLFLAQRPVLPYYSTYRLITEDLLTEVIRNECADASC